MDEKLAGYFKEITELVEPEIERLILDSVDERHHEAVMHQMKTGGKRVRPVLVLLASRMFGGKDEEAISPAAGLEIMHNYTLLIDDQIDHSEFRRNVPTVWKKFGYSSNLCFSIYYASSVMQSLYENKRIKELSYLFAKTLKIITNGEILDILYERSGREDEAYILKNRQKEIKLDDYLDMISAKTAVLFEASLKTGAICADASEENIELLKDFGFNLGIAFQIRDDILDIFGDQEKFGKEVGKDIKERKASNIVILLTISKLNDNDKNILNSIFKKDEVTDDDVKEVMGLINKTDAKEVSEKLAEEYIKKAQKNLEKLPQNEWNTELKKLSQFIVQREK